MILDLAARARASSPRGAVPSLFKPSLWMWAGDDPRLHPCFARWLRENAGRDVGAWALYECPCYDAPTER